MSSYVERLELPSWKVSPALPVASDRARGGAVISENGLMSEEKEGETGEHRREKAAAWVFEGMPCSQPVILPNGV